MALQETFLPITFAQGLDTETNEKTVPVGRLTTLQNGVFRENITIVKRYGTDLIPSTRIGATYSQVSGCLGLASRLDESELVMLASTDEVLGYDQPLGGWVKKGDWLPAQLSVAELPHRPYECWDPTTASTGSVRIVAWQDSRGGIRGQLLNAATYAPYSQDFQIAGSTGAGSQPKARLIGGQFHVFFVSGSGLYDFVMPHTTPMAPTGTVTAIETALYAPVSSSVGAAPSPYSVVSMGLYGLAAWLAQTGSFSGSVRFAAITANGNVGSPSVGGFSSQLTLFSASYGPALAVTPDGAQATVVWAPTAGSGLFYQSIVVANFAYTGSAGATYAPQRINELVSSGDGAGSLAAGYCRRLTAQFAPQNMGPYVLQVAAEVSGNQQQTVTALMGGGGALGRIASAATASINSSYVRIVSVGLSGTTATGLGMSGTVALVKYGSQLASEAFSLGGTVGRNYAWMCNQTPLQATDFLVRLDDGRTLGRSRAGLAYTDVSGSLYSVDVSPDGNTAVRAVGQREVIPLAVNSSGTSYLGRDLAIQTTVYHASSSWQPVDVGGVLMMPGAWLGKYDGIQTVENGFGMQVEGLVVAPGSGTIGPFYGAGMLLSGTSLTINATASYSYTVVPEWFDAQGNRELGSCAYVANVQLTGTNITGQNPGGLFQNSASLAWPSMPHTMRDGINAPLCNFAVYRTGPNGTTYQRVDDPRYPIVNTTGSSVITWTDQIPESIRAQGEVWYQSSQNANVMQASPSSLTQAGDRVYIAGLEGAPFFVAASNLRNGGAVAFTNGAGVSIDARGGSITALGNIDDQVVVFKESRVFSFISSGPTALSSDDTPWPYSGNGLTFVTSEVGVPAGSFAANVAGQNAQGLMFRSLRGFRLLDRGGVVSNVGFPVPDLDDLTLTAAVSPKGQDEARFYSAEGTTQVYNTRFVNTDGSPLWGTFTGQAAVAACIWQGNPVYAMADGRCFVEDPTLFADAGTPYSMVIETGWIPLQERQGLSRVWELFIFGDYWSPHQLQIEMAFDDRDSYIPARLITTSASLGIVPYGGGSGYGVDPYGGQDPVYQFRVAVPYDRCQAIRFRFTDISQQGSGRSYSLTELKLRVGMESGRPSTPTRKNR